MDVPLAFIRPHERRFLRVRTWKREGEMFISVVPDRRLKRNNCIFTAKGIVVDIPSSERSISVGFWEDIPVRALSGMAGKECEGYSVRWVKFSEWENLLPKRCEEERREILKIWRSRDRVFAYLVPNEDAKRQRGVFAKRGIAFEVPPFGFRRWSLKFVIWEDLLVGKLSPIVGMEDREFRIRWTKSYAKCCVDATWSFIFGL